MDGRGIARANLMDQTPLKLSLIQVPQEATFPYLLQSYQSTAQTT